MDVLQLLGVALGLASLAGINLYLTVLVTGLAIRLQWITLAPAYHDLAVLSDPIIIGIAAVLYLVEFFADKIPWIDTAWDAVHTFIRPIGAAALAMAALGTLNPIVEIAAALLAGGVALSTHVAKTGTRLAANGSPEPISNIGLSLVEDGVVIGGLAVIAWNPIVALLLCLLVTGTIIFLLPKLLRGIRAKLWLAWKKLNSPPENEKETEPSHRLPGAVESILRRSHASNADVFWAVPCLSGKGQRLPANLRGWLVALHDEPDLVFFVARRWSGAFFLELDVRDAEVEHRSGFLADRVDIQHRDGSPRHSFIFERGLTLIAQKIPSLMQVPSRPEPTREHLSV